MFSQDRGALRQTFIDTWDKARSGAPMEPLESRLGGIIEQHPEYQPLLAAGDDVLDRDWLPEHGESNPFLHMALHMTVLEQVQTDRPPGIRKLYQQAVRNALGDAHAAEHELMTCLAEMIWQVYQDGQEPNLKRYLKCIKRQLRD